ncbi:MAG TPA: class I SAM-dependent methyltransferase, partial [Candidatus Eisenbacteria bacterium]|nr:class I SAM-dependent methyltransferase [Candidatus Eisenbacteria bacterium]
MELTREAFERRLEHCRQHLEFFFETRPDPSDGFRAVELGTGWFPTVPVGLYLSGATEVWTFDIASLLSPARLRKMLDRFKEYDRTGELRKFLPRYQPERMAKLREVSEQAERCSPDALLKQINIHFRVQDACETGLEPGIVDLFVSTAVLEYIPYPVLKSILLEFKRTSSPQAVQSHYINLRDQYSYFDPKITPFNYLQYPAPKWRYFNSPL